MSSEFIELKPERNDEGEIHYAQVPPKPAKPWFSGWAAKIAGIALGVALFLLAVTFFIYIVIPIILILIVWNLLRRFFALYR